MAVLAMVSVLLPMAAGALGPLIVEDLDISRAAFGLLGSGYYLGAAFCSQAGGRIVRAIGPRLGFVIFLGSQVACLAAVKLAGRHYPILLVLFVLYGVGGAALMPCTNAVIVTFTRLRGLGIGLNQAAVPAASLLAGSVLAPIGGRIGWRSAVAAVSIIGLAALVWTAALLRRPGPAAVAVDGGALGLVRASPGRVLHVRWAAACTFLGAVGIAPTYLYTVLYLTADLGMDRVAAASVYAASGLTGMVARLVWGMRFSKGDRLPGAFLAMALSLALVPLLMMVATPSTRWLAVLAILLAGLCSAWMTLVNAAILTSSDADVASATGLLYAMFFGGMLVSGPLFGFVVDVTSSYRVAWLLSLGSFAVTAVVVVRGKLWRDVTVVMPDRAGLTPISWGRRRRA